MIGFEFEEKQFKTAIGALLAISVPFWNDPLKFAAVIALGSTGHVVAA